MINLDGHFKALDKYSHATLAYMTHGGTQQRLQLQVVVLNWLSCIRDSFFPTICPHLPYQFEHCSALT